MTRANRNNSNGNTTTDTTDPSQRESITMEPHQVYTIHPGDTVCLLKSEPEYEVTLEERLVPAHMAARVSIDDTSTSYNIWQIFRLYIVITAIVNKLQ